LASHSYWHELLRYHDRQSLSADLARSKKLLEDLSGSAVNGFRAPGTSMARESAWAFDVILEQGFRYDSSISPGYSSHGGFASPFFSPHWVRCPAGELIEVPISTVGIGSRRIPYAGGGHLRLLPYFLIRHLITSDNRSGRPANVYVHPREIDLDQPRMQLSPVRSFKYYVGLKGTEAKMRALMRDFRFVSIGAWLDEMGGALGDRVLDVRESAVSESRRLDPNRIPPPPPGS
jgi:polysaccharide deacetylase family protein (PEP-CTERM system associated)